MIPRWLLAGVVRRTGEGLLNLKGLLATLPASVGSTHFGPFGVLSSSRNWRWQSTDSERVVGRIVEESGRRPAQSKGLTNRSPADGLGGLSVLSGERAVPRAYLLIQQGLMAKLLRTTGEGLLNLKDLLTVIPPRLTGLFENEPCFETSFLCRIEPNSAIFCQERADNGRK